MGEWRKNIRDYRREAEILELAERGWTFQEIADHYGFSRERARQILKRMGYESKDFADARHARRVRHVLPLYYAGKPLSEIARERGVTFETVRRLLRKAGYDPFAFRPKPTAWTLKEMLANTKPEGDCMIWQGTAFPTGYPRSPHEALKGVDRYAHREVYKLMHGELPEGMWICHTCDVKMCINPEHMEAMTPQERVHMSLKRDRFDKWMRTGKRLDGEAARPGWTNNKLTVGMVRYIKRACIDRTFTQRELAKRFGVTQNAINAINTGRTWKDVEPARSLQ